MTPKYLGSKSQGHSKLLESAPGATHKPPGHHEPSYAGQCKSRYSAGNGITSKNCVRVGNAQSN